MSEIPQVHFPSLMEFLGWHGTFILATIATLAKSLLTFLPYSTSSSSCPCTGHVVYGSVMLGLPAVSIYLVAFYAYFYQDDKQQPWKVLKAYYRLKQSCSYSPRSREWGMHSGVFHQCTECQAKWRKIKITVSFFISWVYPIWLLALGFLQKTYYVCAHVGPDPDGIMKYCDNWSIDDNYKKKYELAKYKSQLVGNVLFVVVIALVSAIFIAYRFIRSKVADVTNLELEDNYDVSHTPVNTFGHDNEARLGDEQIPGVQARMGSVEGSSPGSKVASYEGFRDRSEDMGRGRTLPRDTQPLVQVDG